MSRRQELTLNDRLHGVSAGLDGVHRRITEEADRLSDLEQYLSGPPEVRVMFLTHIRAIQADAALLKAREDK